MIKNIFIVLQFSILYHHHLPYNVRATLKAGLRVVLEGDHSSSHTSGCLLGHLGYISIHFCLVKSRWVFWGFFFFFLKKRPGDISSRFCAVQTNYLAREVGLHLLSQPPKQVFWAKAWCFPYCNQMPKPKQSLSTSLCQKINGKSSLNSLQSAFLMYFWFYRKHM